MKIQVYSLKTFILLVLLIVGTGISAQTPPPPPPNGGHGINGNKAPGDGAPTGNGTFILLTLAAAYAGRTIYSVKATETQE